MELKERGLRTVVNLREEAVESEFFAKQAGLDYLHLSVVDWEVPLIDQVDRFVELLNSKERCPALVHCAAGVGRTGTFVACYRAIRGMNVEEAIRLTNSESPIRGLTMNRIQEEFVRAYHSKRRSDAS